MVQRRDTPAARAALARRRQRAAQLLLDSDGVNQIGNHDHDDDDDNDVQEQNPPQSYDGGSHERGQRQSSRTATTTSSSVNVDSRDANEGEKRRTPPVTEITSRRKLVQSRISPLNSRPDDSSTSMTTTTTTVTAAREGFKERPTRGGQTGIELLRESAQSRDHPPGPQPFRSSLNQKPLFPSYFAASTGEPKTSDTEGGGHTVAGHTVDGTTTTAGLTMSSKESYVSQNSSDKNILTSHQYIVEKTGYAYEKSSTAVETTIHRSKAFNIRPTESGALSPTSTFGEHNIEAVLRENDISVVVRERYEPISKFGYVEVTSPQPSVPDRRNVMLSYYPQPGSPPQRQHPISPNSKESLPSPRASKSPQKVTITSPQHHHLKADDQTSRRHSPPPNTSAPPDESNQSSPSRGLSDVLQLPSLKQSEESALSNSSRPIRKEGAQNTDRSPSSGNHPESIIPTIVTQNEGMSGRQNTTGEKTKRIESSHGVSKLDDRPQSLRNGPSKVVVAPIRQRPAPSKVDHRPFHRSVSPISTVKSSLSGHASTGGGSKASVQNSSPVVGRQNAASSPPPTRVDRATVIVSTRGLKQSRIPSPPPLNPEASRLLPRRHNISPRRAATPEKRLSPRRFGLPPSGRTNSPPQQTKQTQVETKPATKHFETRIIRNSRKFPLSPKSVQSLRRPKVAPVPSRINEPMKESGTVDRSAGQSPSVEKLSLHLSSDSFSATETSHLPELVDDRVENSRVDRSNGGSVQSTGHLHPQPSPIGNRNVDENLDTRMNSWVEERRFASGRRAFENSPSEDVMDHGSPESGILTIDSQCLRSMQHVMLKSCSALATIQASNNQDLAELNGPGLGNTDELFRVVKHSAEKSDELMYGDSVVLVSATINGRVLGVRRGYKDHSSFYEVGFFDKGKSKADQWMIVPATPGTEISLGRATTVVKPGGPRKGDFAFVRNFKPIILRNASNGGILSVKDGRLTLMTDSFETTTRPEASDPSLLGRLQHHDRLVPSKLETFQLILHSIPPCPSWAISSGADERHFLTGSYMLELNRNFPTAEFEARLFDGRTQASMPSFFSSLGVNPNLSLVEKEKNLIDEVIGSFLGLEGRHIRLKGNMGGVILDRFEFQLFDADGVTFDLSLRNLVEQILPLSTGYVRVQNFIASHYPGYEYGRVMQAFAEGLDLYAQQFVDFVSQLEAKVRKPGGGSELVTMKSVHFEITPLLHSMSILEHATKAAKDKRGGALINAIWSLEKRVYMGDTVAKDLLGTLLEKCSIPYVEMLTAWLRSGHLLDPYSEFMVKHSSDRDAGTEYDGDAWMALFTTAEEHVIRDIIPNDTTTNKILVTGKYWNAVEACHVDIKSFRLSNSAPPNLTRFKFQSDFSAISSFIESSYQTASKHLIHLLKDKFKLSDSLQTMKRYFLLDQGDFLVHFLDTAEEELLKPAEDVSIGRVQHYLSMAVQQTEAQRDGEADLSPAFAKQTTHQLLPSSLRCRFARESLVEYLDSIYGDFGDHGPRTPSRQVYGPSNRGNTGFELFAIDFPRVPFPVSLVLSRHSMEKYKQLFRHLFSTKHVERRLVGVWSDHQLLKKLDTLRGLLGPSFLLRQRMLHFVQNLINYMTFEVVENNWLEMMTVIDMPDSSLSNQKQQTVDDILKIHDDFLEKTLEACLLTNASLIRSLTKLLHTCVLFTDQMKRFMETTRIVSFWHARTAIFAVKKISLFQILIENSVCPTFLFAVR
jgi:hypothetical protein